MAEEKNAGTEPVLRFENVSLHYGAVTALEGISFEMLPGHTRIVLGAAGSGKTTLLKAAIGLQKPDSGRIFLLGRDITRMKEQELFALRRRVGVLFQEGGLFDSMTVADNVAYPLVNQYDGKVDLTDVEEKVRNALRFVELEETLDKYPSELSGGMRRRVGIARAVVTEPPLVLYDSPTAGLDPITANTIMALIAKERDTTNTANLIVTHRYQDGELMAEFRFNPQSGKLERTVQEDGDHSTLFMVMDQGRVVFEGTEAELEAKDDPYIKKFVPQRTMP